MGGHRQKAIPRGVRHFPGGDVEFIPFESRQSLLDADIVVFEPSLGTLRHLNQVLELKPNAAGLGVNLNAVLERLLGPARRT